MANQYNDEQIVVLEGLEAVRKRPGMYIGDTYENGLHHLVWEIVDNSIDEYLAGRCDKINVTIHKDNSITVVDNGSGIPVGMHKTGKPTLEVVLTVLHAGGKFGGENSGYKVSGGLHGVGSSVVNALSEKMIATVKRDGKIHCMEFTNGGHVSKELEVIGACDETDTGTTIWFKPDAQIFRLSTEYSYKRILERLRESAFLNKGLTIDLTDERKKDEETGEYVSTSLHYERGIAQYIEHLNKARELIHQEVLFFNGEKDGIEVEIALQYHNGDYESIYSFVNNIKTPEGGTHEAGFKAALTSTFNSYISQKKLLKGNETIDGKDTLSGLTAIVSVKIVEEKLQFEGQTKSKLGTKEARGIVNSLVSSRLVQFFDENPQTADILFGKVLQSYRIRMAAKRARELEKNKNELTTHNPKPVKFKDCDIKDKKDPRREVFFVEGDSAGGSAKGGRDRLFQAIMPLRGKITNTEKKEFEAFIENAEIKSIISIVGTGILDDFDYEKLAYNKIIIMTDADVDGKHIAILLLTFFYRYMKPLVEKGHIYLAKPPLYKFQVGKMVEYLYTEQELAEWTEKYTGKKIVVQRYKGLGEMNPEQLGETTMLPESRTLIQMTIDDEELVEKLFVDFMGKDATPRKEFLEKYGHEADIDA